MTTTGGGSMDDERGTAEEPKGALALESVAPVRSTRPRALWAVLAVVVVVAGALVVTSGNDDNQRRGLPIDLGSAARSAAGTEAAADSMLAWVVYVPGDDLPALGGEATAYRLSGDVSEDQVRELAAALGLDGDVESDGSGSYSVTGASGRLEVHSGIGASWSFYALGDGCAAGKGGAIECSGSGFACPEVDADGTAVDCAIARPACDGGPDCAVNSSEADCAPGVECDDTTSDTSCDDLSGTPSCTTTTYAPVPPSGPPDSCAGDCIVDYCEQVRATGEAAPCPTLPAGDLPSEDDARAKALEIVAASGADVDGARITASASFRSWFVTVEPELDGQPSGLISFIEIGPDLHVLSGNGSIGQPVEAGEYPLLDTRAAIERANAQSGANRGEMPVEDAVGAEDSVSSTTGGTDTGGTDDIDATEPGSAGAGVAGDDPCAPPEGASDGCGGGTTGCGGDGCVEPTTTVPCKVQEDGREICEYVECLGDPEVATDTGNVESQPCPVDPGLVDPIPDPRAFEIVLVDAEPSLMLFPANDGSGDAYLVPAYRFTAEDGSTVDLPAVADDALSGPTTTETVVPEPSPVPVPEPQPCEVLEEGDDSGTTITVQTCPTPNEDPPVLGPGEEPAIGVGYYVDAEVMDAHCTWLVVELGDQVWWTPEYGSGDLAGWSQPTEGGTITLSDESHAEFVGDDARTKIAQLVPWDESTGVDRPLCE